VKGEKYLPSQMTTSRAEKKMSSVCRGRGQSGFQFLAQGGAYRLPFLRRRGLKTEKVKSKKPNTRTVRKKIRRGDTGTKFRLTLRNNSAPSRGLGQQNSSRERALDTHVETYGLTNQELKENRKERKGIRKEKQKGCPKRRKRWGKRVPVASARIRKGPGENAP